MSRLTLALAVLLFSCASPPPPSVADRSSWDAYASAVEESVWRYENEAQVASRSAHPLPLGRYEAILTASLAARGLTMAQFHALARSAPRFYFTQQALYALRLDGAELRASAGADHRVSSAP